MRRRGWRRRLEGGVLVVAMWRRSCALGIRAKGALDSSAIRSIRHEIYR